jgi:hypothetical protein
MKAAAVQVEVQADEGADGSPGRDPGGWSTGGSGGLRRWSGGPGRGFNGLLLMRGQVQEGF